MKKKIDLQDILAVDKKDKKQTQSKPTAKKENESSKEAKEKILPPVKNETAAAAKATDKPQKEAIQKPALEQIKPVQPEASRIQQVNQMLEKREESDAVKEYVTFLLKNEEYAIDSDFVRQIIKYKKPLDIGLKSDLFFGVTNMKDGVLPLVDFRRKFGMSEERKEDGSIIILQIDDLRVGVYVDYLVGIVRFKESDIKPIPPFLPEKQLAFVSGIGLKEGKFKKIIVILNHLNLFTREDFKEMKRIPEMYK